MPEFATRKLGNTALELTELGLGCAAMAGKSIDPSPMRILPGRLMRVSNRNIRYVDTAPFYGFGRSEHFVGAGLRHKEDYVLSTKAGRLLGTGLSD